MNQNKEAFSIDLTEDETNLQEKSHNIKFKNYSRIRHKIVQKPSFQNNVQPCVQPSVQPYSRPCSSLDSTNRVLINHQNGVLAQNEVQSPLLPEAVKFLQNLQKANPQIETVFIESDEEDNVNSHTQSQVKICENDMVITNSPLNSPQSFRETNSCHLNIKNPVKDSPKILGNNKAVSANRNKACSDQAGNGDLPFTVRAISPSKFNKNLANNSSTIALEDETNKSTKNFLVIHKGVAPFLVNTHGPITLDIPGIGPILIPKPSEIFNIHSVPQLVNIKSQESVDKKVISSGTSNEPLYDPLSDSKYCWRYQRRRKRDLEGFTITDRLGFYTAEQKRNKMCLAKYNDIFKRIQISIDSKEKALTAIRRARLKMENVKLIEIDSIKKAKKKDLLPNKYQGIRKKVSVLSTKSQEELLFSPKLRSVSPIQLSSDSDSSQVGSNLLVTKKVVFIKETENPRGRKRKRGQGWLSNQYRKKVQQINQDEQKTTQNLMVYQAALNNRIKEARIKNKARSEKQSVTTDLSSLNRKKKKKQNISNAPSEPSTLPGEEDIQKKSLKKDIKHELSDSKTPVLPIRNFKIGQSEMKPEKPLSSPLSDNGVYKIKPCHVEIPHSELVQQALEKYNDHTNTFIRNLVNTCKIIDNLKQFQDEIQPIKPILVINENHCATMDFPDLFCKYNIVFPMSETTQFLNLNIKNRLFVMSAQAGYIKFVKPRILCRYLAGFREP